MPKKKHTQRTEADVERELDSLSLEDAKRVRDILIEGITNIPHPAQSLPPEFRHLVRGQTMDDYKMAMYISKRLARELGIPMDEYWRMHPNEFLWEWEAEKLLESAKEEEPETDLGEQLKAARKDWKHTQPDAAREMGISESLVSRVECGKSNDTLRPDTLRCINAYIADSKSRKSQKS